MTEVFFESDIKFKNKQATFEPAYIKPSITSLDKQNFFERKIVNIFLPISFN